MRIGTGACPGGPLGAVAPVDPDRDALGAAWPEDPALEAVPAPAGPDEDPHPAAATTTAAISAAAAPTAARGAPAARPRGARGAGLPIELLCEAAGIVHARRVTERGDARASFMRPSLVLC